MVDALKLKSIIMLNGKTQGDCAKILNITESTFSLKINNKSKFDVQEVVTLCDFLGIDISKRGKIFLLPSSLYRD